MKLFIFLLLLIPLNVQAEDSILKKGFSLLNEKKYSESFSEQSKSRFNIKLGYAQLTKEENNRENLLNLELEAQYSFHEKWAAGFGIGNWFELNSNNLSNNSGTLSSNINLSLTYALTGSLIKNKQTTIHYTSRIYQKDKKILIKHDRVENSKTTHDDGWRIFVSAAQMNMNRIDGVAYGYGAGLAHDWSLQNGDVFQVGWKYVYFNNSNIEASLGQLYISYGFLP